MDQGINLIKNRVKEIGNYKDNPAVINIKTGDGDNKIVLVACGGGYYYDVKYLNYNNRNYNPNPGTNNIDDLIDVIFDIIRENETVNEIVDNVDLTLYICTNEPGMFEPVLSDPNIDINTEYLIDGANNTININAAFCFYLEKEFPNLDYKKIDDLYNSLSVSTCYSKGDDYYKTVVDKYFKDEDKKKVFDLVKKAKDLKITGIRYRGETYNIKNVEFLAGEIGFYQEPIRINYEILPGITVDIISSFYHGCPT